MPLTHLVTGILLAASAMLVADVASSQTASTGSGQAYPIKPVALVTGAPGGPNNVVSRLIATGLTANLAQPVSVVNLSGGEAAAAMVAKAAPDGHTLLVIGSTFWLLPFMQDKLPWDPLTDFAPITLTSHAPNILAVHSSLPVSSVTQLLALTKARPGQLVSATGPAGSATFLGTELLKVMAGVNIVRINYKGNEPALKALLEGEAQMMVGVPGALMPHVKSGRLRALAVTSEYPSTLHPELPTVSASGLPGYESVAMTAIFAPAKTPGAVITRINQEIARVLNGADAKQQLLGFGLEVVASSPEELTAKMKSEMSRLGKVIKDAGIRD